MSRPPLHGWIGVDLDATLAHYGGWRGGQHIGEPIEPMIARVRAWIAEGREVRVFTARASDPEQVPPVRAWLDGLGLSAVGITNVKDFAMVELWDDRCVQVKPNTGAAYGPSRIDGDVHVSTTVPDETVSTLLRTFEALDRLAEANRVRFTCAGLPSEFEAAMAAEREAYGAWNAALAAWRAAGYPPASVATTVPDETAALRAQVERLTDLVRHQRGALHTEGLITDAEYAALAGLTGSPARLEGYDALRGELAIQTRATNVAIGERGALQAIRAYLDAVVTQPGRDDFPEWHALADEDRDRLQAWGDRVCQAGMDAENEATEEAEDAARHAAEQADILLTTIRLALGDNPAGNGWKPPTGVHPVVDLALNVSGERDEAHAALATARIDGARAMLDKVREVLADRFRTIAEINDLDPAAVVGSGS